jgi:hypothetical protein
MTAAERCARCRGLCSLRDCHERGGATHEAGPGDMRPAPRSPDRTAMFRLIDAVVVLMFFGFSGGLLAILDGATP